VLNKNIPTRTSSSTIALPVAEKLKNDTRDSESMGLSMTNFSKNRDPNDSINFKEGAFFVKNKKSRKSKLPSLMEDTPRASKPF
jgi:hypothetical protein